MLIPYQNPDKWSIKVLIAYVCNKDFGMRSCRIVLFFTLLFSSLTSYCQQTYFLYIQNDQRQPFFVKLDRKVWSSSNTGYLIIPKLPSGPVNLAIGFPKSTEPDLRFTYTIDKQDAGFLLRSFGDKGFGLFNLQTLDVVMQQREESSAVAVSNQDPFAEKLAKVVGDPSIAQQKTAANNNPAPAVQNPAVVGTSLPTEPQSPSTPNATPSDPTPVSTASVGADSVQTTLAETGAAKTIPASDSVLVKSPTAALDSSWKPQPHIGMLSSGVGEAGLQLVYVDTGSTRIDTIQVLIPAFVETAASTQPTANDSVGVQAQQSNSGVATEVVPVAPTPAATNQPDSSAGKGFLPIELPSPHQVKAPSDSAATSSSRASSDSIRVVRAVADSMLSPNPAPQLVEGTTQATPIPSNSSIKADSVNTPSIQPSDSVQVNVSSNPLPAFNSDCKSLASEDDFLKLRKKMAAGSDDDDMISIARKAMKSKCYTTTQIRNLSVLFLNDAGRYGFLDMAYAHASDTGNYPQLVDLIKDAYYINRFKAMIRQ